eukprot:3706528-Rhodomonas_salina.1
MQSTRRRPGKHGSMGMGKLVGMDLMHHRRGGSSRAHCPAHPEENLRPLQQVQKSLHAARH